MINIVIPMAGYGSRFSRAGYVNPKPLISVLGVPMIQLVIENLRPTQDHQFIFICHADHLINFPLRALLEARAPNCQIIEVQNVTEGAACTVLLAKKTINNSDGLMIANCDQYIDLDIDVYLAAAQRSPSVDGFIMTMKAYDNKWSFIKLNDNGEIVSVVEKEVVSDEATVGIYNYAHGSDFVEAAEKMIAQNLKVNNEFYVAPTYNQMIADGKTIGYFNIGALGDGMYGLGTPEDLEQFQSKEHILRGRPL